MTKKENSQATEDLKQIDLEKVAGMSKEELTEAFNVLVQLDQKALGMTKEELAKAFEVISRFEQEDDSMTKEDIDEALEVIKRLNLESLGMTKEELTKAFEVMKRLDQESLGMTKEELAKALEVMKRFGEEVAGMSKEELVKASDAMKQANPEEVAGMSKEELVEAGEVMKLHGLYELTCLPQQTTIMNTTYRIKNFRNFGKQGVEFTLSPITILTGANSAGKSSLVKSLMVLKTYLEKNYIVTDYSDSNFKAEPASNIPLLFSDGELKLGRFDSAINSACDSDDTMVFEYDIESTTLGCPVSVSLEFSANESDDMNNGWINSVKITNQKGDVVYHAIADGESFKMDTFKLSWFKERFIKAGIYAGAVRSVEWMDTDNPAEDPLFGGVTEETFASHKQLFEFFKSQAEKRLSSAEKGLFLNWIKVNNGDLVATRDFEQLRATIEYGALSACSKVVRELCELNKEEAISKIEELQIDSSFDADKVERVKLYIVDSLRKSDARNFRDWYSAEEDQYLDSCKKVQISAVNFFEAFHSIGAPSLFGVHSSDKISLDPIVFDDIATLFCLADEEVYKKIILMERPFDILNFSEYHMYQNSFYNYVANIALKELLVPDFAKSLNYIGSAQVVVNRLYSNQAGNNSFSDLLLKYFNAKRNYTGGYEKDSFLNKWIDAFGLGKSLTLKNAEGGLGLLAILHKTEGDKGRLLADEGYGITQLLSIILNIELAILTAKTRESWKGNHYVLGRYRSGLKTITYLPQTLAIEEPENHLHPRLQSLLADMFLDAYTNYNIHFIIETHSEYLIRKTQVLVAQENYPSNEEADKNSPFRTFYLPSNGEPYSLGYRKDGKFVNEFGKGFYDEAADLMFQIL